MKGLIHRSGGGDGEGVNQEGCMKQSEVAQRLTPDWCDVAERGRLAAGLTSMTTPPPHLTSPTLHPPPGSERPAVTRLHHRRPVTSEAINRPSCQRRGDRGALWRSWRRQPPLLSYRQGAGDFSHFHECKNEGFIHKCFHNREIPPCLFLNVTFNVLKLLFSLISCSMGVGGACISRTFHSIHVQWQD